MTNNDQSQKGTLLPFGPEASELAVEHAQEGHPTDPPELSLIAKCPVCYGVTNNG